MGKDLVGSVGVGPLSFFQSVGLKSDPRLSYNKRPHVHMIAKGSPLPSLQDLYEPTMSIIYDTASSP